MWAILWWIAIHIALPMGLAYLGGRILVGDAPEEEGEIEGMQSRSWSPRTTQTEGLPRPRAYGKNMHSGNIVSRWTDVAANREILYMIVEHGDGPTKGMGSNIVYLNDQPAGNFGSVNIQERLGTTNQTVMTGFEKTKLEYSQNVELLYGEAVTTFTTPNDFFDDLEYTICFPNGFIKYHKDGESTHASVGLKVRMREVAGAWSVIYNEVMTGESKEPLFYNFVVSDYAVVTRGTQYELEFSRLTEIKDRSTSNIYLRSVREVIDVAFTRPGKALIGIKAVATSQLSGRIDVKVVREDRIINTYNGATWTLAYSNNRAWVIWDMLTQPAISGDGNGEPYVIERYEGIDPAYLDLVFFYAFAQFCAEEILDGYGSTEARAACNTIVDAFTDVFSLAHKMASVGRAQIYWKGDSLTGWIDDAVDTESAGPIAHDLVTMDNVMAKTWRNVWAIKPELTGVIEVLYKDEKLGYEKTSAEYASEDAGGYRNINTVEGVGITSRGAAIHYAKYLLTRNQLIRNVNEFKVAKDGFRYSLGNVIRVQSRPANWGHAYRVVSATADTITVNRDVTDDVSLGDILHIRSYDTVLEQVVTDSYEVDSVFLKIIRSTTNWDVTPVKNNLVAIGASGDVKLRRITKLLPTMDNFFNVTVETYDTDLFDTDNIDPDNPNVNYIWPAPAGLLVGPVTRAELSDYVSQILPPQPDIDIPWPSNLTWSGDEVDTVTWAATNEDSGADDPITFRYRGVTYEITPDSTTDEYVYWDPDFATVFSTTNLASTAMASGHWLMCVNKDGVAYPANAQQLIHCAVLLAGTLRAETYLELRNTYVYNGDDSLDVSHPLEVPFKIVSEMIAVQSIKLSFRIMSFRAYSTAASSGGGETASSGGSTWPWGNTGYASAIDANTDSARAVISSSAVTDYEDIGSHLHTMSQHNHSLGGTTDYADGTGSHTHDLDYQGTVSNVDPGDTNLTDLNNHQHELPAGTTAFNGHVHGQNEPIGGHNHAHNIDDHTHTMPNHVHGITYGLYEESNSPTIHYHINNGAGYGGASGNYTTDQLDIDITASISAVGWKGIRFDTDLRCRVAAIIECKLDINA